MTKQKLLITKRAFWLAALVLLSVSLLINDANYQCAMAFAFAAIALLLTVFVVHQIALKQDQASHLFVSENMLNELDRLTANEKEVSHAEEN